MIRVCTLTDSSYLLKGLAMRQSLIDTGTKFVIWWLCLDQETYDTFLKLKLPDVKFFLLTHLESDPALIRAQNNPPSNYGSQRDNYIWALTPYFTNYILHKFIEPGECLFYVDSDIYFYQSPEVILDAMNNHSIGLHTHRFGPTRKNLDVGWYNVGVVVFRKDMVGVQASDNWKYWLLNIDNPHYKEYGTCGDQKYLELIKTLHPISTCVFDDDPRISHRAPWCCDEDGRPVVFFHFSHFNYNLQANTWSDSNNGEWKPSRHSHIRPYYERYFESIKKAYANTQLHN